MAITPMDIYNKQFKSKMHGYDSVEVDSFLDEVISSYSDALDTIKELEQKQNTTSSELEKLELQKDKINDSILAAQESADMIRTNAEQKAAEILAAARKTASDQNEIGEQSDKLAAMKQNIATLQSDYDRLKNKVGTFRNNTKMLLQRELEQLDDENWQYWIDQYYGTDRLYPVDGEPIDVNDETLMAQQGELDSDATSDVKSNHEEEDNQEFDVSVESGEWTNDSNDSDSPVIVFPEDYKNHN